MEKGSADRLTAGSARGRRRSREAQLSDLGGAQYGGAKVDGVPLGGAQFGDRQCGEPATWGGLSIEDLAAILDADHRLRAQTHARLAWIVRQDPALAAKLTILDRMARDAGMASFEISVLANQRFDRLVELERWEDPAAVFDLEDAEDVFYPALIRIATARAERVRGRAEELEIKERLLAAEVGTMEERMEQFVLWLLTLSPKGAEMVMDRLRELFDQHSELAED